MRTPFAICSAVSGDTAPTVFSEIGSTRDDAAGEAFDKVARVLELPYPGGPLLDKLAETGDDSRYRFPAMHTQGKYDFSFSGLKTAVINQAHTIRQTGGSIDAADWAASFRKAVVDALLNKAFMAVKDTGADKFALAGGVASNLLLRREAERRAKAEGVQLYVPPARLCTDNAAMIGAARTSSTSSPPAGAAGAKSSIVSL